MLKNYIFLNIKKFVDRKWTRGFRVEQHPGGRPCAEEAGLTVADQRAAGQQLSPGTNVIIFEVFLLFIPKDKQNIGFL
jgi:hypothetical protein